eukprot:2650612-Karenia_brevis.AAC.1
MCRLVKALYGHPESGAHWERHLTAAIYRCGGEPILDHPSSFWFPKERLMFTVYVDDLLLSGPAENHNIIWKKLTDPKIGNIKLDDPEELDRFLGRSHITIDSHGVTRKS